MLHFTWLSDRSGQDENIFILDEWGLTATPINQYKPLITLTESNCFVFFVTFLLNRLIYFRFTSQ